MTQSQKTLFIDIPCDRLQEIRLIHALSEGFYEIVIPPQIESRFKVLKEKLGMKYQIGIKGDIAISKYLTISHEKPLTRFADLERTLVFPSCILDRCYKMWPENRKLRFSFIGLVTESRRELINKWALKNFNSELPSVPEKQINYWISRLINAVIKIEIKKQIEIGELTFWSSNFGRVFPGKSWDEDYYNIMTQSQFVLCPPGDCVWSYRFYEAIMCGAIPIVEKECDATIGFEYYTFSDDVRSLTWCKDKATNNFKRLFNKFTIHSDVVYNKLL